MFPGRISEGAVLSMLIPPCVSEAVFPALSVHTPVADCPAPSVVTVWLTLAATTPEVASVQDQFTVTSVLFQPLPFGAVRPANIIAGPVLSSWIVTESLLVPPKLVAEQDRVVPAVSLLIVVSTQPVTVKEDSGSETDQVTD